MKHSKSTLITSLLLAAAFVLAGCSEKLPEETSPSPATTTTTAATTEAPTEPSESETSLPPETEAPSETTLGPNSTAQVTEKAVQINGQLSVKGTDIVNQNGEPYQLRGMSTYGLNNLAIPFNDDFVTTMAEDWGCNVIRLAMYTWGETDSYMINPDKYFNDICNYVDLCIAHDIYVIVDWHILYDGDPNEHTAEAVDFFSRLSAIYSDCPNIIYEICNEPNGNRYNDESQPVDWECIKPYAKEVIAAIRENDPDNIIIVGTPNWSSDVDIVCDDPLEGENLMYTFHFYATSSKQEKRDRIQVAYDKGLPMFCTEWGCTGDTGGGKVDIEESQRWIDFMAERNISWCNWSIAGGSGETSNALKIRSQMLTPDQKMAGHWPDQFLSKSGYFVRSQILGQEYVAPDEA